MFSQSPHQLPGTFFIIARPKGFVNTFFDIFLNSVWYLNCNAGRNGLKSQITAAASRKASFFSRRPAQTCPYIHGQSGQPALSEKSRSIHRPPFPIGDTSSRLAKKHLKSGFLMTFQLKYVIIHTESLAAQVFAGTPSRPMRQRRMCSLMDGAKMPVQARIFACDRIHVP